MKVQKNMEYKFYPEDETPLDEKSDLIVPFSVIVSNDCMEVCAFARLRQLADAFAERFSDDPFTKEAQQYLESILGRQITNWEYGKPVHRCTITYVAEKDTVIANAALPETIPIASLPENTEDLTFLELDPSLPGFATVIDGKIVSAAVCNDPFFSPQDTATEIAVETSESYRRRGYAVSNVAALAAFLQNQGKTVRYICDADNLASCKTAARAGFTVESKGYFLCAYHL